MFLPGESHGPEEPGGLQSVKSQAVGYNCTTQPYKVYLCGCTLSLEKETAAHSSILAWRIPWTEEPGGPWSTGSRESDTTEATKHAYFMMHFYVFVRRVLSHFSDQDFVRTEFPLL